MTIQSELENAFNAVGLDVKQLRSWVNGEANNLTGLTTTDKSNLVAAVNELVTAVGNVPAISDGTISASTVWSSTKIDATITSAINSLLDGAPGALDTINELAEALNDNPSVITSILDAQAKRVAVNSTQSFTAAEKLTGCTNLGIGDPATNFLSIYTTARDT